jgi:prepilin peptidase CpaA|tara:strand:+ start:1022 stop:1459 length:438 start_codon:yes stop_codon:yes gene_type:complete
MMPGVLFWALLVALSDLKTRRIPNLLLVPGFVVAVLAVAVTQASLFGAAWPSALGGMALAMAPWLWGYRLGHVGAGDAKFAAILGLMFGAPVALAATLVAMAAFGLLSLIWVRAGWKGLRLPVAPWIVLGFAVAVVRDQGGWVLA